ncbi:MAG TPA: hypothetical protein VFG42_23890 [Baekduia sp.]|uniref:hypothetical protein n=1 Tax=Baekduia sp. TaxID=2600305 RepID=UPI002D79C0F3|nr:hypothetical protein [Baekduia sp.]HET6509856.1 hypothetical protein [Baekduia sp.]
MGLLDDAIREHLDLKRRRGADPGEIAREEAEALGPVRREAPAEEPSAPASSAGGSYADHEPAALDEPAAAYDDDPLDDEYEDEPIAPPHGAGGGTAADERDRPHPADPPANHDDVWAEDEDDSATPPHGDPMAHQATREFSATELGDALGHREAPPATPTHDDPPARPAEPIAGDEGEDDGAEDELDQTPDFLQETPEHDRLWFEQKPPKDFDF